VSVGVCWLGALDACFAVATSIPPNCHIPPCSLRPSSSPPHPSPPQPPTPNQTAATSLVTNLLGAGYTSSFDLLTAAYTGDSGAGGIVKYSTGGCTHYLTGVFNADATCLTTGSLAMAAKAQNTLRTTGTALNTAGSPYIPNSLDAATLSFKIKSKVEGCLSWQFLFASEEYPEYSGTLVNGQYVGNEYNDGFELLVNGGAVASLPDGTQVKISNVNAYRNPSYFVSNWLDNAGSSVPGTLATEFDGLTTLLRTREFAVSPGQELNITMTIADVQAGTVDSAVCVPAGSFMIRNCTALPQLSPVRVSALTGALDWTRKINWDIVKSVDTASVDVSNLCKHVDVTYAVSLGLTVQERFTAYGSVLVDTTANITVFGMTAGAGCTFSGCAVSWILLYLCRGISAWVRWLGPNDTGFSHLVWPLPAQPITNPQPTYPQTTTAPPEPPPHTQPAAPSTNLTAGQQLNCSMYCDYAVKPYQGYLPVQISWGFQEDAAATRVDYGYLYISGASLNIIDPCAYVHDIANGGAPKRLSDTQYCYNQNLGTRQAWTIPSYTTTLTSDECAGRYREPTALAPGGRRLQQSCKTKKSTSSFAEYRNRAVATRDYNGTDLLISSTTVVVELKCPAGCAGPNNYLQTATSCCQCADNEEWKSTSKTCVKCKTGYALDTSYKCASICYSQFGSDRPIYKAATRSTPYTCVACPTNKPEYEPTLGECLAKCPASTPYRVPGKKTCTATPPATGTGQSGLARTVQPFLATSAVVADTGVSAPISEDSYLMSAAGAVSVAAATPDCAYDTLATLSECCFGGF